MYNYLGYLFIDLVMGDLLDLLWFFNRDEAFLNS